MVAAIAALAAGLMIEAGRSHDRMAHLGGSQQAALHLDAALLLVGPVLRADWQRAPDLDHLNEAWARAPLEADIDRGRMVARLADLQGRFNVNSLVNASDAGAARGFERLLRRLGLPVSLGPEIAGFLQPRGPVRPGDYAARPVPVRVQGGAVERVEALRLVRGMTEAYYARLAPFVAACRCARRSTSTPPRRRFWARCCPPPPPPMPRGWWPTARSPPLPIWPISKSAPGG